MTAVTRVDEQPVGARFLRPPSGRRRWLGVLLLVGLVSSLAGQGQLALVLAVLCAGALFPASSGVVVRLVLGLAGVMTFFVTAAAVFDQLSIPLRPSWLAGAAMLVAGGLAWFWGDLRMVRRDGDLGVLAVAVIGTALVIPKSLGSAADHVARLVYGVALSMQAVAIGWYVYSVTRSPFALGLAGLSSFLPAVCLSLITGHVADAFNRRLVLSLAFTVSSLASLTLFLLAWSGVTQVGPIYACVLTAGAARAFANPAAQSLTPNLVKAILQYTAQDYGFNALTEGAGFLNTKGAVDLARFYRNPVAQARFHMPNHWSKRIIWGNYELGGGVIFRPAQPPVVAGDQRGVAGEARVLVALEIR